MPDTPNGDGYDARMHRMNETITSLIDSMRAMRDHMVNTHKLATEQHRQVMDEIRELIILQKEQRIELMALLDKPQTESR